MEKPFEIIFDFPLASSDLTISLRAKAELHHSDPYYVISDFHPADEKPGAINPSSLPPQSIRKVKGKKGNMWVHRDTGKETLLSMALGKAIDEKNGDD